MSGKIMVNLLPTILYSCMLGMTFFALLETFKRPRKRQSIFLLGLFILLLIHIAGELFIYSGAYVYAPSLAGIQLPLRVLLGPAFYFYAHATMSPDKALGKHIWMVALSGPVVVLVAMLPFLLMMSPEAKLALANPATRDPDLWGIAVFTCLFSTAIFIVFTFAFLAKTLKLHSTHQKQLLERYAEVEQRSVAWIRPVIAIWGVAWLLYATEFSLGAIGWYWAGSGIVLPLLETIALAFFIQKSLSQKILNGSEKGLPLNRPARTALLSAEKMEGIAAKLQQVMTEEKAYLLENLSLNKLSALTRVSENHISETLSQYLGTNFFHFVNDYRIEEAKKALLNKDKLVISIAYEVGFNSKSTFNTAFKKRVGQNPAAYRRSHL
ncbi:helix-turn-helix transcriptional regulator [Temperatibacter marinus]|uniref:Helix-turn-helix transcriptional regulator n=1 Tax=Temperatibacter marinus TaxID=1456591 RepID=A0AA52HAD5_9PROT|nr:helix-turn-helix transcriptional regulator [Temperatibacter marinus]WND03849.1 helix-turn-helix transcriptional regulator [Temperatibacter marinus]